MSSFSKLPHHILGWRGSNVPLELHGITYIHQACSRLKQQHVIIKTRTPWAAVIVQLSSEGCFPACALLVAAVSVAAKLVGGRNTKEALVVAHETRSTQRLHLLDFTEKASNHMLTPTKLIASLTALLVASWLEARDLEP